MLLDSNILSYAVRPENSSLRGQISAMPCHASTIARLETLGYHRLSAEDRSDLDAMFSELRMLPIDEPVIERAIQLRQLRRMSLGDALTAATALIHDLTLATRNTDDFDWIAGLKLWDPFASPASATNS